MRACMAVSTPDAKCKDRASKLVESFDALSGSQDVLEDRARFLSVRCRHAAKIRKADDPDDVSLSNRPPAAICLL
jgi:hypothetical protein